MGCLHISWNDTAVSGISKHLTFKDLAQFCDCAKVAIPLFSALLMKKITMSFASHAPLLSTELESYDMGVALKVISNMDLRSRRLIKGINLSDIFITPEQLKKLLDLCSMVSHVRLDQHTALSKYNYRKLVDNPLCKQIEMPGTLLEDIPQDNREKITGIAVHIKYATEVISKFDQLERQFPFLRTLKIHSKTISRIHHIPPNVKKLICNNTSICEFEDLPDNLEVLDVSGCPLKANPIVPRNCVIIWNE